MNTAGLSNAQLIEVATGLGRRDRLDWVQPSPEVCEKIARHLRAGVSSGLGSLRWTIRHEPGQPHTREQLRQIADLIEEGFRGSAEVGWILEIRSV